MKAMRLRIIADDLTGALDSAAPFATPAAPVRLLSEPGPSGRGMITVSTESRDLSQAEAIARVAAAFVAIGDPGSDTLWFKKVDSVLRGHPLAETLAMARAGGFRTCVFAPAFPDMGRITRDGRQLVRDAQGRWEETRQGDLRQAIAGMRAACAPGLEVAVLDAETREDLRKATRPWLGLPQVLWVGSRGLADALAPVSAALVCPPVGLFVIGTNHPATRAQVEALAGLRSAPASGLILPDSDESLLLDPVPLSRSGQETRARLAAALARVGRPIGDAAVLVTGGDSLTVVLRVTGALALDCLGEVAPGLPLSRIVGGSWDGAMLISKSGGFGSKAMLERLSSRV